MTSRKNSFPGVSSGLPIAREEPSRKLLLSMSAPSSTTNKTNYLRRNTIPSRNNTAISHHSRLEIVDSLKHLRDGISLPRTSETHPLRMSWLFCQTVLERSTPATTHSRIDSDSAPQGDDGMILKDLVKTWIKSELGSTLAQQMPKGPSKETSYNSSTYQNTSQQYEGRSSITTGSREKAIAFIAAGGGISPQRHEKRSLSTTFSHDSINSSENGHISKAVKDDVLATEDRLDSTVKLDHDEPSHVKDYNPKDRELEEQAEAGIVPWNTILVESSQTDGPSTSLVTNQLSISPPTPLIGNFALSSCPGKKVRLNTGPVNGKAMISRDLNVDISRMADVGIGGIICCLNDAELRYLGAPWDEYERAATRHGITVFRIPIIEGAAPSSIEEVDLILDKTEHLLKARKSVLCHCRGGVGRAGVIACCYLIRNKYVTSAQDAIRFVRLRRSPKAIETRHQEDFIHKYFQHWSNLYDS